MCALGRLMALLAWLARERPVPPAEPCPPRLDTTLVLLGIRAPSGDGPSGWLPTPSCGTARKVDRAAVTAEIFMCSRTQHDHSSDAMQT